MKKITVVSASPCLSTKFYSGSEYFVSKQLEHFFDVKYIFNLKSHFSVDSILKKIYYNYLLHNKKGKYSITRSPGYNKDCAKQLQKGLKYDTDIFFSASSLPLSYFETNKPKVFYTDATFAQMVDYYIAATGLSEATIREGNAVEKHAYETCSLIFLASQWAKDSAINDYGISPDKIKVIPRGAGLSSPFNLLDIDNNVKRKMNEKLKILFVGIEWARKRGNLVIDAVRCLNEELGLPAELHLVGNNIIPVENLPDYVINHGYIGKNVVGGFEKIEKLYSDSHIFFVPSLAECLGISFCEAMSYGLPCVSTITGGIPTIIQNGYNGILLPIEASAEEYAKCIYQIFTSKVSYVEMSKNAYNEYVTRLNWKVAGETITKYLNDL
jgi:glycosyltransferase involved in cell wall biosynthesis